jgi:NAD(P)-dependent dehydrogenase (short-subunit alcohol dehydrogenase family)
LPHDAVIGERLRGKTVVITGGCGDIGKATALRLCNEGARAVLLDLNLPEPVKIELKERMNSGEISYLTADVTNRSSLEAAFGQIVSDFKRLDVVIANAGIVCNQTFLEITIENWQKTLNVNLSGAFSTAQIASRIMLKQAPTERGVRGKILFTGSWVQDMPWPEGASYIASKTGVKMLAKTMAQELASLGIRVNVLAPGIVMAGLSKRIYEADPQFRERVGEAIPLGEMQSAESVADAFAFLCSGDSDYMTGAVLLVDGGASLVPRK